MRKIAKYVLSVVIVAACALLVWLLPAHRLPAALVAVLVALATAVAAGAGNQITEVVQNWLMPGRGRAAVLRQHFASLSGAPGPPLVSGVDPLWLGVHTAAAYDGSDRMAGVPPVPAYVRRDCHGWTVDQIKERAFVLLQGRSAAGKTRLAFEAMREAVPKHRLLVPDDGKALAALAETGPAAADHVIWLDNVERYLTPEGLTSAVLDRLRPPGGNGATVLATLRAEARRDLEKQKDSALRLLVDDVLKRAVTPQVPLDSMLSPDEQARARESDDPRVREALSRNDQEGFGAALCGGRALADRWERGRSGEEPVGAALVTAAAECRRAGYHGAVPRDVLKSLYPHYLEPADRGRGDLTHARHALTWATTQVNGVACLRSVVKRRLELSDYLLDHIRSTRRGTPVPAKTWDAVVGLASATELVAIAVAANGEGDRDRAMTISRAAFDQGEPAGSFVYGMLLSDIKRVDEAMTAYRMAAEAGHAGAANNLGVLLASKGRLADAEAAYKQAIALGDAGVGGNLGLLLQEQGRLADAEAEWRRAAAAGYPGGAFHLGRLLASRGDHEGAADALRKAEEGFRLEARAGNEIGMYFLGLLLAERGDPAGAEEFYRQALDSGYVAAGNALGTMLAREGRLADAEAVYRQAIDLGDAWLGGNLGLLLKAQGRLADAETEWRLAADAGDPGSVEHLKRLSADRDNRDDPHD